MVFNETTNYDCILPNKTYNINVIQKQDLQTSGISSKAVNHPFNKTSLVFADIFTENTEHSSYVNRTSRHIERTIGQLTKVRIPCRL